MLRYSKKTYFEKLLISDQNCKSINSLKTAPTLTLDNEVFSEDCDKAMALNAHSPDVSTLIFHHCNLSLLHMARVCCYEIMLSMF